MIDALPITLASGGAAIGNPNPGGGIENWGGIIPGGPGGIAAGGINGAAGIIGGTKAGGAGGNPGTAGGVIPSLEAYS